MGKRLLALLMALVLVLTVTGCGGKEQPDGGEDAQSEATEPPEQTEQPPQEPAWQPEANVNILVPDEAGSLVDITARVLAQYLEKYIGRLVNVENVPGAYTQTNEAGEVTVQTCAGALGWMELAGRAPDGLTLGYIELPAFSNALYQWPDLFSENNYTPICTHTTQTAVIVARADENRFTSLRKMVTYGKNHGSLVAATDEEHGQLHTWTQLFAGDTGLPYSPNHQGSVSAMLQCLRDGAADFAVVCADDILERDEGLQVLGVFGDKRLDQYPDAPALSELGLYSEWLGRACCVVAPAGIPYEAAQFYSQAFQQAMADERYLSASSGITNDYKNGEDTQSLLSQQQRIALRIANGLLW